MQIVQMLRRDSIPFNIVTLEDETLVRHLFSIPEPEITFDKTYSTSRINIVISFTKQEIKEILKDRENLEEIMLKNEYLLLSELNVLTIKKDLLPAIDDPDDMTPAEENAIKGSIEVPKYLLKANLRSQGKLPFSRTIRITGKYSDVEKAFFDEKE